MVVREKVEGGRWISYLALGPMLILILIRASLLCCRLCSINIRIHAVPSKTLIESSEIMGAE
jgi:hypothetical protein